MKISRQTIKKILPFIIIILLLLFIRNTAISILDTAKDDSVHERLGAQIEEEKRRQVYLEERLYYVQTDEFIEEEAKDKLGMLEEGEFFVIAPTESPQREELVRIDTRQNWQKWLDLLF